MTTMRHADVDSLLEIAGGRPAWRRAGPATESLRGLGLTRRQAEVLLLLSHGRSNKEIAARLGISRRTVEKHLEHVFRTLGVGTRSAATARAWALGGPPDAV